MKGMCLLNETTKTNEKNEFDFTSKLLQQISTLCFSSELSDAVFIVDGVRLSVHKTILSARSAFFREFFFAHHGNEHTFPESPVAFKQILKYIYTGIVPLPEMEDEVIGDFLRLAEKYSLEELIPLTSSYLISKLNLQNCCIVLNAACSSKLKLLKNVTLAFMDKHQSVVLKSDGFNTLKCDALRSFLKQRDTSNIPETETFKIVVDWQRNNPNVDFKTAMTCARLPITGVTEFLSFVKDFGIDTQLFLDGICGSPVNYHSMLRPKTNIASAKFNAKTIRGENPFELLNGNTKIYDETSGFTFHIMDGKDSCIMVEFGRTFIINQIKILLWDRDDRSYCYFVEVSEDKENWKLIHSAGYKCKSWQTITFEPHVVRYIKLVGTKNTVNNGFHVVALEAYFSENPTEPARIKSNILSKD